MPAEPRSLTEQESKAIMRVCALASVADGLQDEAERTQLRQVVDRLREEGSDLPAACEAARSGALKLEEVARDITSSEGKNLAYEMAVCVCNADGSLKPGELQFLQNVRSALALDADTVGAHQETARALIEQPVATPLPPMITDSGAEQEVDRMILNASILNGALEIMPQTLATMAIVPLQMRLVYQIGRRYGFELDRGHIKDFLATVGVGLSSQVMEGFARQLVGGLTRRIAGRFLGGLASQATGSAVAFASTYALGQVAKRYYSGGRKLGGADLKEVFTSMLSNGRSLQTRYAGEIASKAGQVNLSQLLPSLT